MIFRRPVVDFGKYEMLGLIFGRVFAWDGRKVRELGGTGLGLCLCIHNGQLIEGGTGGVLNYSTGEMYERDGFVQAVCSHQGTLYDSVIKHRGEAGKESVIRETIKNKVVARRSVAVMSLCSHGGLLYDGSYGFEVHETMSGKLVSKECDANVLCSHEGHLYAGGSSGIVFDVFEGHPVARRDNRIWGLCSMRGVLYDSSEYGGVYETMTGRKVLDYAWIKHPRRAKVTAISSIIVAEKQLVRGFENIMKSDPRWHYMDKEELLALQMRKMGELGYPFLHAIENARDTGADEKFVQEAYALLAQLSGKPGDGAIECMKNAKRDLRSTEAFLNKWRNYRDDRRFVEVLDVVERIFEILKDFNETIDSMSFGEKLAVKLTAILGRGRL